MEVGPSLNLALAQAAGWQFELRLPARAVFTVARDPGSIGWTSNPALYATGDVSGWDVTVSASRRVGDFWIGTYMQADSLRGAVFETSPLVRQLNNIQYGIGVSWVFKESSERARDGG